jgi:hypothetical protein
MELSAVERSVEDSVFEPPAQVAAPASTTTTTTG